MGRGWYLLEAGPALALLSGRTPQNSFMWRDRGDGMHLGLLGLLCRMPWELEESQTEALTVTKWKKERGYQKTVSRWNSCSHPQTVGCFKQKLLAAMGGKGPSDCVEGSSASQGRPGKELPCTGGVAGAGGTGLEQDEAGLGQVEGVPGGAVQREAEAGEVGAGNTGNKLQTWSRHP